MVTSYTWHPGSDWLVSKWPVPVPLEPDELFSTWLVRIALAQGCTPLVLAGQLWPTRRIWAIDIDRSLSDEHFSSLATVSGLSIATLRHATLRPIELALCLPSTAKSSTCPWLLALGARNRKRHGGLQYCPACFACDKYPFYRLQWRLAWHTCCAVHHLRLLDQCGHCGATVEPHRLLPVHQVDICATCGKQLRSSAAVPSNPGAQVFQNAADQVIRCGAGMYGEMRLPAHEWFALARYFVMLLRSASRNPSSLCFSLAQIDPNISRLLPPVTGLALEMLPPIDRALILECTGRLIAAGPTRFDEVIKKYSVRPLSLRQGVSKLPFPLDEMFPDVSAATKKHIAARKAAPNRHATRKMVIYRWARFLRRIGEIR